LVIIDYLQLIEFNTNREKKHNRSQELGYITRKLKLLAQFLELPVITISQLNRNIESRSNKEPLLSDLKESGCIALNNIINIKCNYQKYTNIININNKKIITVKNQKKRLLEKNNIYKNTRKYLISYLNLSHKYTFNYFHKIKKIITTHNHKCLSRNSWIESHKILYSTAINYCTTNNKKTNLFFRQYIYKIKLNNYSKSYDINQNQYFILTTQNIITHNSIEQDADIILTLYQREYEKLNPIEGSKNIIDIKIAKNRNGKIGYCKLFFLPDISTFYNTNEINLI